MARATGDKDGRMRRAIAFDLVVLLGLVGLFVASLCLGSVETTPAEVLHSSRISSRW